MPLAGMRIRWQLFPARQRNEIGYIALVVAVQDPVLSQYESVCEAAGLLPQEVRVSSFALFDFWLKAAGGERRLNQDIAWVSIADGGLTCLIVHDYRPVFVRTKQLTGEAVEAGDIRSLEWTEKIVRETAASLLACREHYPKLRIKTLILAMDQEVPGLQNALGDELEVKTERFNWDSVRTLGWIYEGGAMPLGALPAVAGMV
ncbi:hypothetical protein [Petrachloros mirabilis]